MSVLLDANALLWKLKGSVKDRPCDQKLNPSILWTVSQEGSWLVLFKCVVGSHCHLWEFWQLINYSSFKEWHRPVKYRDLWKAICWYCLQLFTLARLFQIGDIRLEAKSWIRKSLVLRCGKSKRFKRGFSLSLWYPHSLLRCWRWYCWSSAT